MPVFSKLTKLMKISSDDIAEVAAKKAAQKSARQAFQTATLDAASNNANAVVRMNAKKLLLSQADDALKAATQKASLSRKTFNKALRESVESAPKKNLLKKCVGNKKACAAAFTAVGVGSYVGGKSAAIFANTDGAVCTIHSIQQVDNGIEIGFVADSASKRPDQFVAGCSITITQSNSVPTLISTYSYTIISATGKKGSKRGTLIIHAPLFCEKSYQRCASGYSCSDATADNVTLFDSIDSVCAGTSAETCPDNPVIGNACEDLITLIESGTSGLFTYNADNADAIVGQASLDAVNGVGGIAGDAICATIESITGISCDDISPMVFYVVLGIIGFCLFFIVIQ